MEELKRKSFNTQWVGPLVLMCALVLIPASELQALQCPDPDQEAEPLHRMPPAYPHPALVMCLEGKVVLDLRVDERGRVHDVTVVQSEPPGIFDGAARRAVNDWIYQPECADGEPVSTTFKTHIEFDLRDLSPGDCPDKAVKFDEHTLTLMGEIGALYALTAESRLEGLSVDRIENDLTNAAEPALDQDALRVWRYHHDLLLDSVETTQTTQRRLWELGFPFLLFQPETFEADPALTGTQAKLGQMRDALDAHIQRLEEVQQQARARRTSLESRTEFNQQTFRLLTDAFAGRHDRATLDEHVSNLEEQFELISSIVNLYVREQARWSESDFDDPQAGETYARLTSELASLLRENRRSWLFNLQGFEDYSLSD